MIPPLPQKQSGSRSSFLARLRAPTGLSVTILLAITLAFYHGLWLPGLVLIKGDAFRIFLPIKGYLIERLATGNLPQWFPYEALGRPFIGVTATGLFHPFTALSAVLSVPDAYRVSVLISCLLAALGAFVLGRSLNFSRAGSLVAGIAFALSGYVVSLTDNIQYLYATCLLPLFCAALEKVLVDRLAWVVPPAVIWATVLLHGDMQTGYYYGFIALLWTATRAPKPHLRFLRRVMLVTGLAALLAGIQLGPSWSVFTGSERTNPAEFHELATSISTHPLRLLTVLASPVGEDLDQSAVARIFFDAPRQGVMATSLYLGAPVMGLALLGAWHRRDLRALVLLGLCALWLALGRHSGLYEVFYRVIPLWSAFRYPEKLMGVVSFAAAMLAGAGLDALRAGRGRPALWLVTALAFSGAALALRPETVSIWMSTNFGAPDAMARAVAGSAAQAFLFSAVSSLGVWLILAGRRKQLLQEQLVLLLLMLLLTFDLARANLAAYHTGPLETWTFSPALAEAIRAQEGTPAPGRFRLVTIHEELLVLPENLVHAFGFEGTKSIVYRQALDRLHSAQLKLETVIPYLPGFSRTLAATLNPKTGVEAAARLNVTYYVGRRYHLQDPKIAQGLIAQLPPYDLVLFRSPVPSKPRAYLSSHPERLASAVDPMELFTRLDFLNGQVDVIEANTALPGPSPNGTAVVEQYEPEHVQVRVDTPSPAVLILLDAYDQGWTATLDHQQAVPILRANALVRAVLVPAGTHRVTFSYQTPLLLAGAAVSLAGCLLGLGLLAHARWKRHHPVGAGR